MTDSFLDFQKFSTELIFKQPRKIFKSYDFTLISENTLVRIWETYLSGYCVESWQAIIGSFMSFERRF